MVIKKFRIAWVQGIELKKEEEIVEWFNKESSFRADRG